MERGMTPKILIADDEASMRRLLQFALEDLEDDGVELLMAEDGQEALELIAEEQPDLIILDVMMPKMNGFEVCENVRTKLGMSAVSIILLTAKGQEADRIRGEEVGADLYITKPFDPDNLRATASAILGL
jgi:two-component system, OmpR family, alkaline phosphatase synthesis response regulator PhoP